MTIQISIALYRDMFPEDDCDLDALFAKYPDKIFTACRIGVHVRADDWLIRQDRYYKKMWREIERVSVKAEP